LYYFLQLLFEVYSDTKQNYHLLSKAICLYLISIAAAAAAVTAVINRTAAKTILNFSVQKDCVARTDLNSNLEF
jgi:hypothetical protein